MAQRSQDSFRAAFVPTINDMHLILALCAGWLTAAAAAPASQSMRAPKALALKQAPAEHSRTLFFIQRGEALWRYETSLEWTRVKVKHKEKWQTGYVLTGELNSAPEPIVHHSPYFYAIGAGGAFTSAVQNGKSFSTEDEVRYTTSGYKSISVWPYLTAQLGSSDFYRVCIGYRLYHFRGQAKTDVSTAQGVEVKHRMFSFALDKVWNWGPIYLGGGAELAKGLSLEVKLGNAILPTTAEDVPSFFSLRALIGHSFLLSDSFSLFTELHLFSVLNQSSAVYGADVAMAGLYWF